MSLEMKMIFFLSVLLAGNTWWVDQRISKLEPEPSADIDLTTLKPGDKFPAGDGCNTCEYWGNGVGTCTLLNCLDSF